MARQANPRLTRGALGKVKPRLMRGAEASGLEYLKAHNLIVEGEIYHFFGSQNCYISLQKL